MVDKLKKKEINKKIWLEIDSNYCVKKPILRNDEIDSIINNPDANVILFVELVYEDTDGTKYLVPQYKHRRDITFTEEKRILIS